MLIGEILDPGRHLGDNPHDDWRGARSRGSDLQMNSAGRFLYRLTYSLANFEGGEASSPQPQHSVQLASVQFLLYPSSCVQEVGS